MTKLEQILDIATQRFHAPQRSNESSDQYGKRRLFLSTLIHEVERISSYPVIKLLNKKDFVEIYRKEKEKLEQDKKNYPGLKDFYQKVKIFYFNGRTVKAIEDCVWENGNSTWVLYVYVHPLNKYIDIRFKK